MISVIIVNYYSALQTERAIKSVLEEAGEKEIIVVDNTCTAGERDVLDGFRKIYGFVLILNDENVGFARACNQAFSQSKGTYVFLLNPDAFVASPCLEILREFLEDTPVAGSASPQVYWDDERRYYFPLYSQYTPLEHFCARLSSLSHLFGNFYSLAIRWNNLKLWRSSIPVEVKNLHGGAVMVRRSAAEKAGGLFDERFFLFFEDTDLFFRLRKRGYSLYIVPEAMAVHNYSHSGKKAEVLSRMSDLYYEKHFGGSLLLRIISSMPKGSSEGRFDNYGTWNSLPSFPVPNALRDSGYLFEWSPNPVFLPSIGCFGEGREFTLSRQVWDFLDKGKYYSRFTPYSGRILTFRTGCWEKDT